MKSEKFLGAAGFQGPPHFWGFYLQELYKILTVKSQKNTLSNSDSRRGTVTVVKYTQGFTVTQAYSLKKEILLMPLRWIIVENVARCHACKKQFLEKPKTNETKARTLEEFEASGNFSNSED